MSVISFEFMSIEKFDAVVEEYLNNLDPKFREKSLISQELADIAKEILTVDNEQHSTKLKAWVRKHFAIMRVGESVRLVEKKTKKFVCVKECLYNVIGDLHEELWHAGYIKTYTAVSCLKL